MCLRCCKFVHPRFWYVCMLNSTDVKVLLSITRLCGSSLPCQLYTLQRQVSAGTVLSQAAHGSQVSSTLRNQCWRHN